TGVTHVNLTQRRQGYDVFGSSVTVSIARDGGIVFAAGRLVKGLQAGAATATVTVSGAVDAAADGLGLEDPAALQVTQASGKSVQLTGGGIPASPIDTKLGWHASADGQLRLAYEVIIDDASASHLWKSTVDARTGAILATRDLTIHDDMSDVAD